MFININQRRKELGLTLEQIANHVGVSKGTVKKWENGYIKNMGRDKIIYLAEILCVSPLDILDLSDNHKNIIICQQGSSAQYHTVSQETYKKILDLISEDTQKK